VLSAVGLRPLGLPGLLSPPRLRGLGQPAPNPDPQLWLFNLYWLKLDCALGLPWMLKPDPKREWHKLQVVAVNTLASISVKRRRKGGAWGRRKGC
jgi:hypothetical protein